MNGRRGLTPIAVSGEELEVHTEDGRALRCDVREPPRGKQLVGVAVMAHAMMASRQEFERPRGDGLSSFFAARGWRTIAFDFRGHGDSGPGAARGGSWTYDDLVTKDMPAVVASARARAKKLPVVVVGHSLGGHVALAAHGIGAMRADAIACVAANVWIASLEPSRARWLVKRGVLKGIRELCRRRGYFPTRALRMGSDDEAAAYFAAFDRWASTGRWTSDDGAHDYLDAIGEVRIPVLQLASDGDRLNCHPECGSRFIAKTGGERRVIRLDRGDDGGPAPGHMELVTTTRARVAWDQIERWLREKTAQKGRPRLR